MTNLQQELIDKYHSGLMSEAEASAFESKINADPSMKAELDLQADIINGLKETRKLELKARLDAVNVGPTWFEYVQQSALMKSLGGVIIASLVGTGIYFLGEKESDNNTIVINAPQAPTIEYIWDLGIEKPVSDTRELEKIEEVQQPKEDQLTEKRVNVADDKVSGESLNETAIASKAFKPAFEAPNVTSVEDEEQFAVADLDNLSEGEIVSKTEQPIDVKTENTRSSTIKYKYFDGKLYLNGNFNKAPYEILEINSSTGRRIYVFYLENYYKVGVTDKLEELPLVTDQKVIEELKLIRENK